MIAAHPAIRNPVRREPPRFVKFAGATAFAEYGKGLTKWRLSTAKQQGINECLICGGALRSGEFIYRYDGHAYARVHVGCARGGR